MTYAPPYPDYQIRLAGIRGGDTITARPISGVAPGDYVVQVDLLGRKYVVAPRIDGEGVERVLLRRCTVTEGWLGGFTWARRL